VTGELRSATDRGRAWCYLIFACERVRDVERASQWCDTVRRLAERTQHPQLFAFCRTHYAGGLTARGEYDGAEPAARAALDRHSRRTDPAATGDAAALYLAVRIAVAGRATEPALAAA